MEQLTAPAVGTAPTTRHWRSRLVVVACAVLVASLGGVPVEGQELGPGCDPSRASVAHRAGGQIVEQAPLRVPCGTETGQYTGETTIGVTDAGTVWFSAADWEWALVRTHDDGATWEKFVVPGPQAYPGCGGGTSAFTPPCSDSESAKYNTVADAFLYVDPDTSKIFWSKTYGYALCSSMNMSGNDGETWAPVTSFACPGGDYEKIAGGPPTATGAKPTGGYPNVLYTCVNGPAPTFVVGPSRVCYKSLNGGSTWSLAGAPVTPSPLAPGCIHFQEPHAVGPDGTVFMPLGCALDAQTIRMAVSTDEAQTWSYVTVPTAGTGNNGGLIGGVSLAVDEAGTVYVVWTGTNNKVYLAATKDKGVTWTGPLQVSTPGVTTAAPRAQVAARQPGHIAIAYYGYTGTNSAFLNGYLTESFDASSAQPLFHSATLNDPAQPLYFPGTGTRPRNDYLGVTIAPDGTPWTALVKLRSATPDSQGYVQSTGFAGRLVYADGRDADN